MCPTFPLERERERHLRRQNVAEYFVVPYSLWCMVAHPEGLPVSFHTIGTPTLALHKVIERLFVNFFVGLIVYLLISHISLFYSWPIEQSVN